MTTWKPILATRSAPELCRSQNISSPPGLTRWSMLTCGSERLSADPIELLVRMDCRIKSGNDERKKGGETPAGAYPNDPHQRMRRAPIAQRARLSAFHRGACCSERTPQLCSSYALPGTWSGRTIPMVRKIVRFSQRALPAPSCPSPAGFPADRSSCRPGAYPRSRPGAAVTSRRPRETALAPPAGVTGGRPLRERDSRNLYPKRGRMSSIVAV